MKKYLFLAASALALASCSSDDIIGNGGSQKNTDDVAIRLNSNTGAITRANLNGKEAATALDNNFVVVGFKGSETTAANHENYAFDHYNVNYKENTAGSTTSNTKDWEYVGQSINVKGVDPEGKLAVSATTQTIKYWDQSCTSYDFLAFSMGKGYTEGGATKYATPTAVQKDKLASEAYTLKGDASTLSECYISDMKTVEKANYNTDAVSLQFRHLSSKVRIALYETVPGYVISDVKFYEDATTQTSSDAGLLYGTFNDKGTYTVYFPTTGTDNKTNADYNKAHVKFTPADGDGTVAKKSFGTLNYGNQKEDAIEAGNTYLSQSSATPSYCGDNGETYYQVVLPSEDASQPATLRIDYKLTATDGTGEVINVKNATAVVPAAYTAWKSGYAYTYKFKISQNTNGGTGDPDDPKGLTAISFDAVVVDDEVTGQETITTVSSPSITTYGFKDGKVTVDGNEYAVGTDIYATVHVPAKGASSEGAGDATPATTAQPTALYTVTLEKDAAQTINEATVANAIAKGTQSTDDVNPKTYTVTDANGKKMVVTTVNITDANKVTEVTTEDGHKLTVNALTWKAETAGTIYAVEYTDADGKKAYKIVKIAAAATPATPGE